MTVVIPTRGRQRSTPSARSKARGAQWCFLPGPRHSKCHFSQGAHPVTLGYAHGDRLPEGGCPLPLFLPPLLFLLLPCLLFPPSSSSFPFLTNLNILINMALPRVSTLSLQFAVVQWVNFPFPSFGKQNYFHGRSQLVERGLHTKSTMKKGDSWLKREKGFGELKVFYDSGLKCGKFTALHCSNAFELEQKGYQLIC